MSKKHTLTLTEQYLKQKKADDKVKIKEATLLIANAVEAASARLEERNCIDGGELVKVNSLSEAFNGRDITLTDAMIRTIDEASTMLGWSLPYSPIVLIPDAHMLAAYDPRMGIYLFVDTKALVKSLPTDRLFSAGLEAEIAEVFGLPTRSNAGKVNEIIQWLDSLGVDSQFASWVNPDFEFKG